MDTKQPLSRVSHGEKEAQQIKASEINQEIIRVLSEEERALPWLEATPEAPASKPLKMASTWTMQY